MAYRTRLLRAAIVSAIVAGLIAVPFVSASAGGGDVDRRGSCSGPSDWRLRVRHDDDGKLRVRYEVDGGHAGQEWHVFLSDNGVGFFAGTRISQSGGSFEVRKRTADRAGTDTIRAGANNVVTGETCGGRATL
jgi:hypothetical protein